MDLALGSDHDLLLTADGNVRLTSGIPESAQQRLGITLSMFLGEWFLDQTVGIPYFQELFVKVPDDATVRTIFRTVIEADNYVVSVPQLDVTFDRASRQMSTTFVAQLVKGDELTVSIQSGLIDGQIVINGIGLFLNGVPIVLG